MKTNRIVVFGAGPAGMMAAIRAGQLKQDATLIEKNPILGKKLLLSGKGRCNLTNSCDLESFLKSFNKNGQFLRDAFKKMFNNDLIHFFEQRGVKLKIERQMRVFPVSDKANTIVEALEKELKQNKVKIIFRTSVSDIVMQNNFVKGVFLQGGTFIPCEKVILATGGTSYSFTGSTGDGLRIARRLGHTITDLSAGLIPLEVRQKYPAALKGLTLKNIRIKFSNGRSQILSEIGELLFTHFGISGPLVLSLSGKVIEWLNNNLQVSVKIDLKPALSVEQLNSRLLREFKLNSKKTLKNTLKTMLPLRLIDVFLDMAKLDGNKKASQIFQSERKSIIELLKEFHLDILKARPQDEGMVTRGGVSVKEINPRTMESRLIKGLYFAGEIIDVDADTGGFNLQAAFSTGYLAGENASQN